MKGTNIDGFPSETTVEHYSVVILSGVEEARYAACDVASGNRGPSTTLGMTAMMPVLKIVPAAFPARLAG
jgi:hypothetical protein